MLRKIRYKLWVLRAVVYGASYAIWLICRYGVKKANVLLDMELSAQRRLNRNRYNKMRGNYKSN